MPTEHGRVGQVRSVVAGVDGRVTAVAGADVGVLRAALRRLDDRLGAAADRVDVARAQTPTDTAFRGLYIDRADVDEALHRPPLGDTHTSEPARLAPDGSDAGPWRRLADEAGLSAFDLDAALVALAPEVDLSYEQLYAYLQDDVTRRWPTVALVLDLLCGTAEERLACRDRFAADAPLVDGGIVRLVADPNHVEPPLLARYVTLDAQVVALLLGRSGGDHRLAGVVELREPAVVPPQPPARVALVDQVLAPLAASARDGGAPLALYLRGPAGAGKERLAHALAARCGRPLAVVGVPALLAAPDPVATLRLALREAGWRGAVPYLAGVDALLDPDRGTLLRALDRHLAAEATVVVLAGRQEWGTEVGAAVQTVELGDLAPEDARAWWQAALERTGAGSCDVAAVADRFRLTPGAIEAAAADAVAAARLRAHRDGADGSDGTDGSPEPGSADLLAAARRRSGLGLAALAREVEARRDWDDLVVPADSAAQLREIEERLTHRHRVLQEWGFGARLGRRTGTTALFSGPSGTGKTLAAEVLAHRLGVGLYQIDLSGVVSKYIGETEKNLARVFDAATRSGAILFFDEADALFGKRSEVRDSHDRYANIEIAYLLQRIDDYDGLAVLATNLRSNLDESFLRRLDFAVYFSFPDEEARARIWAGIWPAGLPLDPDVDPAVLAARFKLSGGNIRNAALAAAFAAAAQDRPVGLEHVLHAVRREYQKFGKAMDHGGST